MKTKRVLLICTLGAFFLLQTAPATNPDKTVKMMIDKLSSAVQLTDSQKVNLELRLRNYLALNSSDTGNKAEQTGRNMHQEFKCQLDSVLTPEQRLQLAARQKQARENYRAKLKK